MFEEEIIGARSWFIGLTDQGHEGRWYYIKTKQEVARRTTISRWIWQHSVADVDYSSWAPGYPRNYNVEDDCAVLSSFEGYKWTDVRLVQQSWVTSVRRNFTLSWTFSCDEMYGYPVCMRDLEVTRTSAVSTTSSDYCKLNTNPVGLTLMTR